jgi:hypothetical protein
MDTLTQNIRGIPLWLLREYLVDLGGQVQPGGEIAGPDWQGKLTRLEDFCIGSLWVGEVQLELSGEAEAIVRIDLALRPKLLRIGG